ncbi:MAG: hypothetical protein RR051_00525, partial [Clostridiales bacterium]
NAGRQAYLTARSMVDVVLSKIDGYHEDFPAGSSSFRYHNTLIPAIGDRVPLSDFVLSSGDVLDCTGFVERSANDTLRVSVTAVQGGQSRTVKAQLRLTETTSGTDLQKSFVGLYADGLLKLQQKQQISTSADTDVYIKEYQRYGNGANRSRIAVGGTLYTDVKNADKGKINGTDVTYGELKNFRQLPLANDVRLEEPYIALNVNQLTAGKTHLISPGAPVANLQYSGTCDADGRLNKNYNISYGNSYYIKITSGCMVNLRFWTTWSPFSAPPNVYIFIDGDAEGTTSTLTVEFLADSNIYYHLYLLGGKGSTIKLADTPFSDTIYGSFMGDTIEIANTVYFDYVPPEDLPGIKDSTIAGTESRIITHTWNFSYYEKGDYNETE